jgi:uncharacterized membrane protein
MNYCLVSTRIVVAISVIAVIVLATMAILQDRPGSTFYWMAPGEFVGRIVIVGMSAFTGVLLVLLFRSPPRDRNEKGRDTRGP